MIIFEKSNLATVNPIYEDPTKPITESQVQDLQLGQVRAVYPLIRAINSGRLTKNFTFYPAESLIGKKREVDPTGYASYVIPYGKPIITEHRLQDEQSIFGGGIKADPPLGRIIYAGYKKRGKDETCTIPKKGIPGTVEGDGYMTAIPAITTEDAIIKVLGGTYHTVSIGCRVNKIIESISQVDIAAAHKKGEELPPHQRGQWYHGKLSYWELGEIRGMEISYVNAPADDYAHNLKSDVGLEGLRLMLGESKNAKEFCFYDAKSGDLVQTCDVDDEYAFDTSFEFIDSANVGKSVWWVKDDSKTSKKDKISQTIREVLNGN